MKLKCKFLFPHECLTLAYFMPLLGMAVCTQVTTARVVVVVVVVWVHLQCHDFGTVVFLFVCFHTKKYAVGVKE